MLNTGQEATADLVTPIRGRLIEGDALEVARGLPDACIDLIYVDPPFGTGKQRTGRGETARYADPMSDPEALTEWLSPILAECRRTLANHGSLFVHLDYRTVHYVKVALDRLFGRARFVNEIVWCYSVGGKSPRRYGRKHDTILWYSKGADYAFFPDRVRVPRKGSSHMRVVVTEDGQEVQEKTDKKTGKVYRYPVNRGKVPEDWWSDIETLNRSASERCGWPTQKPLRLLERIILGCSEPGWLVADFFCGSGTTVVAAHQNHRRYLGVDAEPSALALTKARLGMP